MEDTKVDESVGCHKEVAEETTDHIEVANEDADEGDGEDKDVASDGVIVSAPAGGEGLARKVCLASSGGGSPRCRGRACPWPGPAALLEPPPVEE